MKPSYPLVESLGLKLLGVPRNERLAAFMVLAMELDFLRHSLHYAGLGTWWQCRTEEKSSGRVRWEYYCKDVAGISDTTVRNYLKCAGVIMKRLMRAQQPGCKELLELMEQTPSKLTAEQRQRMIAEMIRLAFAPGDTFGSLRAEALLGAAPQVEKTNLCAPPAAIVCNGQQNYAALEAQALAFGVSKETARRVALIVMARSFIEANAILNRQPTKEN